MTREKAAVKKLKQLARACQQEAVVFQQAAQICADDDRLARSARVWRGRARTCWKAIVLLGANR